MFCSLAVVQHFHSAIALDLAFHTDVCSCYSAQTLRAVMRSRSCPPFFHAGYSSARENNAHTIYMLRILEPLKSNSYCDITVDNEANGTYLVGYQPAYTFLHSVDIVANRSHPEYCFRLKRLNFPKVSLEVEM